jgi:predicted transcriptional regulator
LVEACSDASAAETFTDLQEIRRFARQHPLAARRQVALHIAHRQGLEQLRYLDDHVAATPSESVRMPWEAVRDWWHLRQNYIDEIDREAEQIAGTFEPDAVRDHIVQRLFQRFGTTVGRMSPERSITRDYDPTRKHLALDSDQPIETTLFSLAYQLGRAEFGSVIDDIASAGSSEAERALLIAGLSNYAAGALLMPYGRFRNAAREFRHDVDRLRRKFSTSFEQTCHRLSTLQRPGAAGVPMFFCRVDMAGNITKRHSATRLQFARFGGACPLWIVHEAAAIPDRILIQYAEAPDGVRYVMLAKGLVKPSGSYDRAPRRYAVALGCEESSAREFIYADSLSLEARPTEIGVSCRICPRRDCEQRAFPQVGAPIVVNPDRRGSIGYFQE